MKTPILAYLILSTFFALHAQEEATPKLPEGPLLKRVDVPAQWVITAQVLPPKDGNTSPAPKPQKPQKPSVTTVIKDTKIIVEKTINENDAAIEIWRTLGWAAMNAGGRGWIISPGSGTTFNRTDYSKTDFPGFDWVSLKNFAGNRDVMGKHCLVFKDKVVTLDPQEITAMKADLDRRAANDRTPAVFDTNSLKSDVEADIDDKTRLPVMLTYTTMKGVMTRSYVFQTAEGSLSLPPELQELLKKYQERQRRMSLPIAPI